MARAVNVLLDVQGQKFDINKIGLTSLTFDRFLGSPSDINSNVLGNLDMTIFDKTGSDILSILQANQNKIRLQYGFENELSQVYLLNLVKFKGTYNNLGIMVGIGGIASQINRKFQAEVYKPGTSIEAMLREFARRNGWYVGETINDTEYINVGTVVIDKFLYKTPEQTDMQFILEQIVPIANSSAFDINNQFNNSFFDVKLTFQNNRLELFFRQFTNIKTTRRVWTYNYGVSTTNNIISMTNEIDYSFLVRGITLQIPISNTDFALKSEEENKAEIESVIRSLKSEVERITEDYGLPIMNFNDFLWNIELTPAEDIGNVSQEKLVLDRILQVMNTINTMELTVIGNPNIMPTDLIEIVVRNKDGSANILSSTSAVGSYWRIITIRESIGLQGYQTTLRLVREIINNN